VVTHVGEHRRRVLLAIDAYSGKHKQQCYGEPTDEYQARAYRQPGQQGEVLHGHTPAANDRIIEASMVTESVTRGNP
jgi:hypothetical protein